MSPFVCPVRVASQAIATGSERGKATHDRLLLITGTALLIVGFANAADFGFGGPTAYGFLAAGGAITILTIVHSLTTKRNAILPPVRLLTLASVEFTLTKLTYRECYGTEQPCSSV